MAGQHLSGPQLAISYLIIRSSRVEIAPCGMSPFRVLMGRLPPIDSGPLQDARLP